ncbi:ATP-binding cassette domain-containing protein, partial [Phreatobacter sp.]|uniref:ATP-binding cassette domain-containing protein n=1 Tax=Phreatobacter sp. TaxID=1966341 RepID=UPI003F7223C3
SSGTISIGDRVVNRIDPADRDIAMVFQNYALYPHMSVYNNLAYGLRNRGVPKDEIDRRVKEAARILEIGAFLERKPKALSGGQRQRVAMGRAIVREPAAFLFDEPLSNLDAKLRVQMRVEIKRLQKSLGTTSVYVTHDQLEAMTLADRLVVLNGGAIEQIGDPISVYEQPASTFVASFIGSPAMNLIPVSLRDGRATLDSETAAGGTGLTGPDLANGAGYTLGVRPEHFVPASERPAGPGDLS